ncbi:MAG: hypothetical protein ABIO63_11910 [Casimicrobiaceae bacterium]
MKTTNVIRIPVSLPRSPLAGLLYTIAGILAWVNRGYNDYDIRELMGELTPAERRAEKAADVAHEQYHTDLHDFYS